MWRNSAMAEPSTRPGASGKFTRGKLGEKLYLQSAGFNLRDPNCHLMTPTYNSLHDPYLKQHFHRPDIHKNLKDRDFITNDDMVICTQKEHNVYQEYVEDIKIDVRTQQLRERQKEILELKEQGLISEDVSQEGIRVLLQKNELSRHDENQRELRQTNQKKSTKKTMKEKDVPFNDGQFPNITMQPTCAQVRTGLQLIEKEIKHEFNRNKHLRDIQRKISQRETAILERRAAAQQAEMDEMREKIRFISRDQTHLLNRMFCGSTSVKASPKINMQRRPTLERLVPLPVRKHDLKNNQQATSSDHKLSLPSDTDPKLHCLGKVKPPTNQHDPEASNARITQAVLDGNMFTAVQNQGETRVEAISAPTVKREDIAGEPLYHRKPFGFANKTKKIGAKISYDDWKMSPPSTSSCSTAVIQSEEESNVSKPQISSDEVNTQASSSNAPFVSSFPCGVLYPPPVDTMVTSQTSREKSVWSSSDISQPLSVLSSQSQETLLCMSSVSPDSTCSGSIQVPGNGVSTITKTQSLPGLNQEIAHGFIQYVTSTACKDRIVEAVKKHFKRSFSVNDLTTQAHPNMGPAERESVRCMLHRISKEMNDLLSREHIMPDETTGSSPNQDALASQVNVAALQLLETLSGEIKQQFTTNIMLESSNRGVSTLGSQTDTASRNPSADEAEMLASSSTASLVSFSPSSATCSPSEDTTIGDASEHKGAQLQLLEIVFNEVTEQLATKIKEESTKSGVSPLGSQAAIEACGTEMLLSVSSEDTHTDSEMSSADDVSTYEVEILSGVGMAPSAYLSSPSRVADMKDNEGGSVPSHLAEPSAPEISPNEFESPADASAALSDVSSSLSISEALKTEEHQPVTSQEGKVSTPEISPNEFESPADASAALSDVSSSLSISEALKTEEHQPVTSQEGKVSTPEICPNEFESPADASAALSDVSSSLSISEALKTEEHQPVTSQEGKVSTPEISLNKFESPAYASAALSGVSSSQSNSEALKTEEHQPVTSEKDKLSTSEISLNKFESPADARAALSGVSSSLRNSEALKTKEHLPVTLQENKASTPEIFTEDIETLAGASAAPCSASSPRNVDVFKTEGSQPVTAQKSALEISLDKAEMLARASSLPNFASSFESAAKSGPASNNIDETLMPEAPLNKVQMLAGVSCQSSSTKSHLSIQHYSDSTCSGSTQVPVLKKECTAIKSISIPSLYPAIADELSKYFTTSFKDRITQVMKKDLKRSFSVNDLPSTPHPKLGPEERKAIRDMLKRVSKDLDDLMSKEHILSLLSPAETTGCSCPENDALLAQLNAAALQLINEVFTDVKVKLATKIKQESPKRGISPVASQVAMKAACKSLEKIKMSLIGDDMCVASTSGIRLSVSSDDKKDAPETSYATNIRTESKIPSLSTSKMEPTVLPNPNVLTASSPTSNAETLGKTPQTATKSLSLPNFYATVVKEVQQHVSTESFTNYVHLVVKKECKRSLSMNDVRPAPHQTLGPEERRFIKDMLSTVSRELSASMSRHSVSHPSRETARPSSASEDDTLRRLNAVALELIHSVYAQVREKLTIAIKEESPKRGLSPVASQTAVNASCRALSAIEMTLMDGVRSPSTPPLLLQKSKDVEDVTAAEESFGVDTLSSCIVTADLTEDVLNMFYMDTYETLKLNGPLNEVEMLAGVSCAPSTGQLTTELRSSSTDSHRLSVQSSCDSTCSGSNKVTVRKKVCTPSKSRSLPSLYPAIADELSKYFTSSFKDNITQVMKKDLKRSFSVNDLPSTPHPKLGPEERKAIRNMLKRVSKDLDDLMSKEHILSLLSPAETTGCSCPENDALLAQLNAAALKLINEVFTDVKAKLATKIKQESPKRGISPVASQVAMRAACKSLEKIKMSLIGDDMCVASTSGIQLSVSSDDKKDAPETSYATTIRTESKIPSLSTSEMEPTVFPKPTILSASSPTSNAATLGKTPHAATKSLSLPSFYATIVKEVQQHISTESFTDYVHQVVKKECKRSLSMNDVRPAPHQKLGPEERQFIKDMLSTVSRELSASMSRHSVSHLSPETARPSSASEDDTLRRLNAVALELIHSVYAQVKEKLTVAIKEESPKRGLSPVASQTAVNAACRTLSAIEMTLMDGVRSPSTPPLLLRKSEDVEDETASEESLGVETSSSSVVTDDLIDDVLNMFYMDTNSSLCCRTPTPIQWAGGSTLFNEVVPQSISMPPTESEAYSTESSDDAKVSLTAGPLTHLLPRITDEILDHFSSTCFKDCIIQTVKNDVRQRVSGVSRASMLHVKDIMEVIVKSAYQKMALLINKTAPDSLIVEYDMPKPATKEQPALGVDGPLSTQELASAIKQITIAVLNHLKTQLCDQIKQKHSSSEESELVAHALNNLLGTMVEYVSNIQFFKEELHCYISKINKIPTQKLIGQWIPLSKLDLVSTCLATSVIDNVYNSDSSTTSSSKTSPEPEAISPVSECMMTPSKPASPANCRSFRARQWLSSSALEKSRNTTPVTTVQSKSLECLLRTDMHIENKEQLEGSSNEPVSKSSITSLEEKRSRVCSPLPNNLTSSRAFMNIREEMQLDFTLEPIPPCKKSNQAFQQLPHDTTKTLRKRRVVIRTVYQNSEVFSDDESSSTSCSLPEDTQSDDAASADEDPSLSPRKRRST